MSDFAMAMTTVADDATARGIADHLVSERLAACVQILPITSIYRWDGKIEDAAERLLLCKIRRADFDMVAIAIRSMHPYDVPELVMLPLAGGDARYFAWIESSTTR